jgi:gas vesicle protein
MGAATGAAMGGVPGAIIGGAIGGVGGYLGGKKSQEEARAALEQMRAQLLQTFGTMEVLRKQASLLGVDISRAFSTKSPEEFQRIVNQLNQGIADQQRRMQGLQTAMSGLDLISKGLSETLKRGVTEGGREAFRRLGDYAAATFGAMLRETGDVIGTLQEMEPTLKTLADGIDQFGLEGSDAMKELLGLRDVVQANQDIAQQLQGLNLLMRGLGQAGIETTELMSGFGKDLAADFQTLIDRGVPANQALILMQPSLQALWEHQQKFHDITDESTLALLNQAQTQGIVGENMKSVNDKILDVLLAIAKVLKADIPDALRNLDGRGADVTVTTHYEHTGNPNGGLYGFNNDGTPDNDGDKTNSFAYGGYVPYRPGGTHAIVGERSGSGGEWMLPDDMVDSLAGRISRQIGRASATPQLPGSVVLMVDGQPVRAIIQRWQHGGYLR